MEKETKIINWEQGFIVFFVSDGVSYTEVAGVISLFLIFSHQVRRKVMIQDFSYEELEQIFNHFPN
jgi:hypothetical protein